MLKRVSDSKAKSLFDAGYTIHLRYPASTESFYYKDAMDKNSVPNFDKFVRIFKEKNLIKGYFEPIGFYVNPAIAEQEKTMSETNKVAIAVIEVSGNMVQNGWYYDNPTQAEQKFKAIVEDHCLDEEEISTFLENGYFEIDNWSIQIHHLFIGD